MGGGGGRLWEWEDGMGAGEDERGWVDMPVPGVLVTSYIEKPHSLIASHGAPSAAYLPNSPSAVSLSLCERKLKSSLSLSLAALLMKNLKCMSLRWMKRRGDSTCWRASSLSPTGWVYISPVLLI